ncbi:LUD domain-containing protein [Streptomyces sp. NPDC048441]|uniref:LUD domain-containing protein n=1 Tax=Streptomyces sp. NPDC048441 TaxID=3365552 RepID=UPI003715FA33
MSRRDGYRARRRVRSKVTEAVITTALVSLVVITFGALLIRVLRAGPPTPEHRRRMEPAVNRRLDQSTSLQATTLSGIELGPLFTDRAQFEVPDLATRFAYKKEDINADGRYDAIRPSIAAIDRATGADEIRRLVAVPDYVVNSVAAVTETGSLVLASGSGSQLPANAGGAAHAVWIIGAQKVVPDLNTALRRVEEHALPLESVRSQEVYGMPSAVNRLLILNADPRPGRGTVLLLREAIGY